MRGYVLIEVSFLTAMVVVVVVVLFCFVLFLFCAFFVLGVFCFGRSSGAQRSVSSETLSSLAQCDYDEF